MPGLIKVPTGGVFRTAGGSLISPAVNVVLPSSGEFTSEFTSEFEIGDVVIPDPVPATTIFQTSVVNGDSVSSWINQELSIGQMFAAGDVPDGTIVRAVIDGTPIPMQASNRVFWKDGSLKHAQVRMLIPAILAPGASKDIVWQKLSGSWTDQDTPLHASPTAITSRVALEYRFTSWKGRNTAGTLTAELGPKTFLSSDMLGSGNSQWIDTIMAGPVCSEWRATDMSKLSNGTKDANFGCLLYARAWGGTAGSPARIEFVYRTMYGWSDGVPANQQGIQCSMDLLVNNAVVRGSSLATPTAGWAARNSYNGGFYASPGATGKTDWFDIATNSFVTPPALVYKHNTTYGIKSKFFPPYDIHNPKYVEIPAESFAPQTRGSLSFEQDNVGDHVNLAWTASMPFIRAMVAHARRPIAEVISQTQNCRVTSWSIAALGSVGFNRTTRKLICHLPTNKNPDPIKLGASVYNGTKPQTVPSNETALNPYVKNQDVPHFPQVTWWTALTEGDQHMLDLAYAEATLIGLFTASSNGFYNPSVPNPGGSPVSAGGIYYSGQTRGVGHAVRPIMNAVAIGHPEDPHHKLVSALWLNYIEAREAHIKDQDSWRNTSLPADGRYFAQIKMYPSDASQEPQYKMWMHGFSLHSCSYAYGITEDLQAKRLADYWAHVPTVLAGGYHNDTEYLMKPDPAQLGSYYHIICSTGTGGNNNDRRPWAYPIQWGGGPYNVTYKSDNQTLDWGLPNNETCQNGMIITITGVHKFSEPATVTDMSKIPGGLVRGAVYYAVQATSTTCKLATTLGGAPVTFVSGGADIVGMASRNTSFGAPGHVMRNASTLSIDDNSYHIQLKSALDMYQHYVAPDDPRVLLARQKMRDLKVEKGGGYDLRGLTTVPHSAQSPDVPFTSRPSIIRKKWIQQPQVPSQIDWSNPLSKGLVFFIVGNQKNSPDLVGGGRMSPIGDSSIQAGAPGVGLDSPTATTTGWYGPYDTNRFRTITTDFTIATQVDVRQFGTSGKPVCVPLDNGTWVDPFASMVLRFDAATTAAVLTIAPTGGGVVQRTFFTAGSMPTGLSTMVATRSGATCTYRRNNIEHAVQTAGIGSLAVRWGTGTSVVLMNRSEATPAEGITGTTYWTGIWNRALSPTESRELYYNPYQLLRPAFIGL